MLSRRGFRRSSFSALRPPPPLLRSPVSLPYERIGSPSASDEEAVAVCLCLLLRDEGFLTADDEVPSIALLLPLLLLKVFPLPFSVGLAVAVAAPPKTVFDANSSRSFDVTEDISRPPPESDSDRMCRCCSSCCKGSLPKGSAWRWWCTDGLALELVLPPPPATIRTTEPVGEALFWLCWEDEASEAVAPLV